MEKKGQGARSNTHRAPLTSLFYFASLIKEGGEAYRNFFFSLLPIDKERHTYDIEYPYFYGIHT